MSTTVEASRAVTSLPGLAPASSRGGRRSLAPILMLLPALALVSIIFLAPMAYMAWLSVTDPTPGLGNYEKLVESPAYLKVSWLTVRTALLVTILSLLIAYPTAYQLSKARPRIANLLLIAVVIPYFVSFLIRTYSWMVILGREGVINSLLQQAGIIEKPLRLMFNTLGVYTGMLNVMTPIMILVLYGVMRGLDRTLVRAARSLGATPLQAFVRVFLPLSMPGVGSASLLVFILSLGFYITPALLGSDRDVMASSLIVSQVNELFNWGMASTLSLVLLAFVGLTYWLLRSVAGVEQAIGSGGQFGVPASPKRSSGDRPTITSRIGDVIGAVLTPVGLAIEQGLNHLRRPDWAPRWFSMDTVLWVFTGIVLFYLIVPVLIVIPLSFSSAKYLTFPPPGFSFQWYEAYIHDEAWVNATLFSIRVGLLTSALALVLGLLATVALVRFNIRGRKIIFILLILPIVVPEIITAVAIFFVFARAQFVASLPSIAIAQTVLAVPYVMLVVAPALRGLDPQYEQAARNLGASPARTFWHITFPLLRPSIIAAALFAFLASFDNLLIALFLSGPSAITLPIKMWQGLRLEINPLISAVSTLEIVIAVTILLLAGQYRSRRA